MTVVPTRLSPTLRFPNLSNLDLTSDETKALVDLQSKIEVDRADALIADSFYTGLQRIDNLDIAIPASVWESLRMVVGWPRIAVDPYVERLSIEGFRLPGDTDVNSDLGDLWSASGLEAEQLMAYTDAFAMGRGYWLAGVGEDKQVRITVESPLNMTVRWDSTGRIPTAAIQVWEVDELSNVSLMLPGRTLHIWETARGVWTSRRQTHKTNRIPVHRMANNPRSDRRNGFSNITPELMTLVVGASRRLVGLEVASELYSVPRMLLLGAQESDFQDPNGQVRKAWDTYVNLVNALERDEEGNLPDVKQLTTYDPATFTKVIEMQAAQAAGILAAPPQDLGLYTDGNPTSSEAWQALETRRCRRTIKAQREFGGSVVGVMQDALRLQNGGVLSSEFERMAPDWAPVMPAKSADDLSKLMAGGSLPARSDVTLKHAGFSAVERSQIEQDWTAQDGRDALALAREAAFTIRTPQPAPTPSEAPVVTDGDNAG